MKATKIKERKPQPPVLKREMVKVYKYQAMDKEQWLTDYSALFYDIESALEWFKNFGQNCEEKFHRKLYLTEADLQKQYRS